MMSDWVAEFLKDGIHPNINKNNGTTNGNFFSDRLGRE
jgi:hypothetical protein